MMFMRYLLINLLLLFTFYTQAHVWSNAQAEVTKIVKHLHTTNGNFTRGSAPTVQILEGKNVGAAYNPVTHQLTVDLEVYRICQSFGRQSADALAFIIGHELAHCYMEHHFFSNFNHYHKCKGSEVSSEKGADIYGLFNAYLAGYNSFQIVPQVISAIYEIYELDDHLSGYPAKQERMAIAKEVQAQIEELVHIYETANYLSALGKYDLAAASYEYILKFYQGREVYNNLGVAYALDALYFTDKDYDLYLFPLELDWETRIKKPKKDKSDAELTPDEFAYRMAQLQNAKRYLEQAGKLDQSYFTADINLLCVMTLMKDYQGAVDYYKSLEQSKKILYYEISDIQKERAQMALAIAKSHLPSYQADAERLYNTLANSRNPQVAYTGTYNQQIFQTGTCGAPSQFTCVQPFQVPSRVDNVSLYRHQSSSAPRDLGNQVKISIDKLSESMVCQFQQNGSPIFTLQRISHSGKRTPPSFDASDKIKMVQTSSGSFLLCEDERIIFHIDDHNRVESWGRYY